MRSEFWPAFVNKANSSLARSQPTWRASRVPRSSPTDGGLAGPMTCPMSEPATQDSALDLVAAQEADVAEVLAAGSLTSTRRGRSGGFCRSRSRARCQQAFGCPKMAPMNVGFFDNASAWTEARIRYFVVLGSRPMMFRFRTASPGVWCHAGGRLAWWRPAMRGRKPGCIGQGPR